MTDNVVSLHLVEVGDGAVLDADRILGEAKGKYDSVAVVGRTACGQIHVLGTHSAAESALLLAWGQNYLVTNLTIR